MGYWKTNWVKTLLALVVAFMVAGPASAAGEKYVLVSHAPDSDSWWNTIKNAIKQAGEDFGVSVDYRNPPNGDLADMARLIEQAGARNYAGVITSIADFDVLKRPIEGVIARKIPVITINSGTTKQSEQLKAVMHVGQPEYDAGFGAGSKAKAAGVSDFVCVNHYATNAASFERCRGFADALGVNPAKATLDAGTDPTTIESRVSSYLRTAAKLQQAPEKFAVLALGPDSAHPSLKAVDKMGLKGKVYFATFDISDEIAKGIKDGSVAFAIDQQPYLQGYIPVAVLAIMKRDNTNDPAKIIASLKANEKFKARLSEYGLAPVYGPRHISSGPGFVTKANLAKVQKYAGQYR